MESRRKPLVLASTKKLLDSILKPSKILSDEDQDAISSTHKDSTSVQLRAGILRSMDNAAGKLPDASFDDSTLVGVSSSVLKRLATTSGSLVLVKNVRTNVGRVGRIVVLDPPRADPDECWSQNALIQTQFCQTAGILPYCTYSLNNRQSLSQEVAYVAPILAFNLGLHISFLEMLVNQGKQSLLSFLDVNEINSQIEDAFDCEVLIELLPWLQLPTFASYLRISYVKVPECGILESLRGISSVEAADKQELIDMALREYFRVDRYLARGDYFCIQINWKCYSPICILCNKKNAEKLGTRTIHFKVLAMEPIDERLLCVNCNQTALVLGGSVASAVPPAFIRGGCIGLTPLQQDAVKSLAGVLTPLLCSSALSSKLRIAVLVNGMEGCGKRTLVKYVASHLGLHLVEYSCYDLISSKEKAPVALSEAFNTAYRYSPAILLLRNFDVFGSLSTTDGSPSDQVGINFEVASVLREYTGPLSEDEDQYSKEQNIDENLDG